MVVPLCLIALVGCGVVNATPASAAAPLSLETATRFLEVDPIEASSANLTIETPVGDVECTASNLTGQITENAVPKPKGEFTAGSLKGDEPGGLCKTTTGAGPAEVTARNLSWPIEFSTKGSGTIGGLQLGITFPAAGGLECVYTGKPKFTFPVQGPIELGVANQKLKLDAKVSNKACAKRGSLQGDFALTSMGEAVQAGISPSYIKEKKVVTAAFKGFDSIPKFFIADEQANFLVLCNVAKQGESIGPYWRSSLTLVGNNCIEYLEQGKCEVVFANTGNNTLEMSLEGQLAYSANGKVLETVLFPARPNPAERVFVGNEWTNFELRSVPPAVCGTAGQKVLRGSAIGMVPGYKLGKEAKALQFVFPERKPIMQQILNRETGVVEQAGQLRFVGANPWLEGTLTQELESGEPYGAQ
jgi:hypothetical protein